MKTLFLLSTVAVLVSCNSNTKVKTKQSPTAMNTDLLQQNLKDKVKSITETSVTIDSAGQEKPDSLTTYTTFDDKGYETDQQTKNMAGKITTQQFMSRNNAGVVTEFGTKKNGQVFSRVVTEFDKDGKYTGGKSYDSTGKQDGYYKDLAQNEYSIVYSGKHYNLNDKLIESWDMKYDKNHFLGGKSTDSTGKATYEGTAQVNDKGDIAAEEYTAIEEGKPKSEKKTYKYDNYDSKGNWIQRTVYNDKGKPTQIVKRSVIYY